MGVRGVSANNPSSTRPSLLCRLQPTPKGNRRPPTLATQEQAVSASADGEFQSSFTERIPDFKNCDGEQEKKERRKPSPLVNLPDTC